MCSIMRFTHCVLFAVVSIMCRLLGQNNSNTKNSWALSLYYHVFIHFLCNNVRYTCITVHFCIMFERPQLHTHTYIYHIYIYHIYIIYISYIYHIYIIYIIYIYIIYISYISYININDILIFHDFPILNQPRTIEKSPQAFPRFRCVASAGAKSGASALDKSAGSLTTRRMASAVRFWLGGNGMNSHDSHDNSHQKPSKCHGNQLKSLENP